jgi:hypothetical protein
MIEKGKIILNLIIETILFGIIDFSLWAKTYKTKMT